MSISGVSLKISFICHNKPMAKISNYMSILREILVVFCQNVWIQKIGNLSQSMKKIHKNVFLYNITQEHYKQQDQQFKFNGLAPTLMYFYQQKHLQGIFFCFSLALYFFTYFFFGKRSYQTKCIKLFFFFSYIP